MPGDARYRHRVSARFEWDPKKARGNVRVHRVSFREAQTVFDDPLAISVPDPDHSEGEERNVRIGHSTRGRLLVITYTERGPTIRIIGARKATRKEQRTYEDE
ncbi:MAG: BrnT family toxin [Candidatus Rokubacteria bacterium]|nr:BrnT family toxin [Candidatus Rokubacteria bacterium]